MIHEGAFMITLNLTQEEQAILARSLNEYLTELKMEISNTENWEFKARLKKEEEVLGRVVSALTKTRPGEKIKGQVTKS